MEWRILDRDAAIPHRSIDVHDRMTRRASQTRLRLRRVDLFLDKPIEATVKEHGMIVASSAPFARLGPDDVLHVFDRFPIELIVEGREVMHRALPLLVDVAMAFAAGPRLHEKARRNHAA